MSFKCPVIGCEDSEKEFQSETALKSHIRNRHPEYIPEEEEARQVPIVEEDFAILLRKFKIKADLAFNIAENISHTGGPRAFEDAEILIKRLSFWSSDITPAKRQLIIDQWFAERGVPIPDEVRQRAGMTTDQIREADKKTKDEDEVRYVYDIEAGKVRMAREGEKGGTLNQAKELKRMDEEREGGGGESPFIQDGNGNWMINSKARVGGFELMAFESIKRSQEKGESMDPFEVMTQAAERIQAAKEAFGINTNTNQNALPAWLSDPVVFAETLHKIGGKKDDDSGLKDALAMMQQTVDQLKEDKWQTQFDAQQKQIGDLAGAISKTVEVISDMKQDRVGRTEMDIIHDVATKGFELANKELPGLRRDIKEAIGSIALPPPKSAEQREDRKQIFKEAIESDEKIEQLGQKIFFNS